MVNLKIQIRHENRAWTSGVLIEAEDAQLGENSCCRMGEPDIGRGMANLKSDEQTTDNCQDPFETQD
jgi:hypothetical protein